MKKAALILLLFFFSRTVSSQEVSSIELGKSIKLQSRVLNESRTLLVYSPMGAADKKNKYPVIYVFDAGSLFYIMLGAVRFMNYGSHMPQMPEAYIVGIVNTNRDRDMPVPQEIQTTTGAANFYKFLSEEVVPFITNKFSTSGLNILVGHSQGGMFVTYAGLQNPKLFPFILALDAPMTVVKPVEKLYREKMKNTCGLKYVSVESRYGWVDEVKVNPGCMIYKKIKIEGETHETMPYKGIYEGLKFLFNDYLPQSEDLPLKDLKLYYDRLSAKYHFQYPIPGAVLRESARQNIGQQKKDVAIALLNEYVKLYGLDNDSRQLLAKAKAIKNGPDERVTYNLNHPPASEASLKPFMGKWSGVLKVPEGSDVNIDWEIKKINGVYKMDANVMNQFKDVSAFLYVTQKNELVWGRKHGGGGIYISVGNLSKDGSTVTGAENMIGFTPPAGMGPLKPNTFIFHKIK